MALPSSTTFGAPLIECGAVVRIPLPGKIDELVLTPDAARELAGQLTYLAREMDGLTFRQWHTRRLRRASDAVAE